MLSQNKPTGVHFALIIFVMLTLVFVVVSFVSIRDRAEAQIAAEQARKKYQDVDGALRRADEKIEEMKKRIGHQFDSVGLQDPEDPTTVLGAMGRDMKRFGGNLAQSTYSSTLEKLRQELDTITQERNARQQDQNQLKREILALQNDYQTMVDQATAARDRAERDKQVVIANKEEAIAAKDKEIAGLEDDYHQVQAELERVKGRLENEVALRDDEIRKLTAINIRLNEKLDKESDKSFEVADGVVRWVDHSSKRVWINLGGFDKLYDRTGFSVYTKMHQGIGRGKADIKGSIEVLRILGPHLAECRILDNDIDRPIATGDPVYTPLWSPGLTNSFSLVGLIDFDGDGQSDRQPLQNLITAAGAKVDNEVDDKGSRSGKALTVDTKFLIVGKIPDPTEVLPGDKDAALEIIKHHSQMLKEARQQGVRVVSLNDFLSFIGFKPTRRLWVPGTEVPWRLQQGSKSTGVSPTAGVRISTGSTSALYKPRRVRTNPGQTQKVFRGARAGY
jgi:hypothetical protein